MQLKRQIPKLPVTLVLDYIVEQVFCWHCST